MQISVDLIHVACNWRPQENNLYATGRQLHVNFGWFYSCCMQLSATRVKFIWDWPPVACKVFMHQRPVACKAASFLQARCENNYLNKKMKTPLKNLRIYATHVLAKAYPLTLCTARSNLVRQFLYHKIVLQHLVTGLGDYKLKNPSRSMKEFGKRFYSGRSHWFPLLIFTNT